MLCGGELDGGISGDDADLLYGGTAALNRAMAAFCEADPRLLAVAHVPWADPRRTLSAAEDAIKQGCAAVLQGAMWVVPWLRRLDIAQRTFAKTEPTRDDASTARTSST